jgi:acyl-CoA synthetase (AMP-forming)/AMP-acid ligase II
MRTTIIILSYTLVLVGAVLYPARWEYAPYLFAAGAAGVTVYYLTLPYQSSDYRMRRLQRINILAGISMLVASALMFKQEMAWVVFLLIAAMLQLYTSFVIKE